MGFVGNLMLFAAVKEFCSSQYTWFKCSQSKVDFSCSQFVDIWGNILETFV